MSGFVSAVLALTQQYCLCLNSTCTESTRLVLLNRTDFDSTVGPTLTQQDWLGVIRTVPHSIGMVLVHQDWPCPNRTGTVSLGWALNQQDGLWLNRMGNFSTGLAVTKQDLIWLKRTGSDLTGLTLTAKVTIWLPNQLKQIFFPKIYPETGFPIFLMGRPPKWCC